MPRPNRTRDIYAEAHLRARITLERQDRGMSYEGLAKRMSDLGCPIDQSAIYKIEKGDPPRRITVDELVAFALVFDLQPAELLSDPNLAAEAKALRHLKEFRALVGQRVELDENIETSVEKVREAVADSPKAKAAVERAIRAMGPDDRRTKLLVQHFTHPRNVRKARKSQ